MILLRSRKLLFVRTQKTASTAVEDFLRRFCIDGDIATYDRFEGWPHIGDEKDLSPHATVSQMERRFSSEWSAFYKFAIDRNPWDRVVSEYEWMRSALFRDRLAFPQFSSMSFEQFVIERHFSDNASIYRDSAGAIKVDLLGAYENLDSVMAKVAKIAGLEYTQNSLQKFKVRSRSKQYLDYYSKETSLVIEEKHADLIDYFGYRFWQLAPTKNL